MQCSAMDYVKCLLGKLGKILHNKKEGNPRNRMWLYMGVGDRKWPRSFWPYRIGNELCPYVFMFVLVNKLVIGNQQVGNNSIIIAIA